MVFRIAKVLLAAIALIAMFGSNSTAATRQPSPSVSVGLPPAPAVISLPTSSQIRPGRLLRLPDGRLALAPTTEREEPLAQENNKEVGRAEAPEATPRHAARPHDGLSGKRSKDAIESFVRRLAPEYDLDPNLVVAVISAESSFRTDVVSPRGATGLMQLMPDTARRFGVLNSYDAEQNLRGGMSYLKWLLSFFRGNVKLALAGYNAGERAVERYAGVPPYTETRNYVAKIMRAYGHTIHPYDSRLTAASAVFDRSETGT
jgi:soluble lytic murein transglycosylase-like protein